MPLRPRAGRKSCADDAGAEGIAAIWQLHLAAARAYRRGQKAAATGMIDIADAAEQEWLRGKATVKGSPGLERNPVKFERSRY
jgi:hypothetical protein